MKSALLFLLTFSLFAADPSPATKAGPVIPVEVQAEIAFTQLDALQASIANDKAQQAAQSAIQKANAICGLNYTPNRVGQKVECVAKPEVPKAEARK